jgi:hypothetical protein
MNGARTTPPGGRAGEESGLDGTDDDPVPPMTNEAGRMLPNFFVIGAPRSGTTSAYEYLQAHPDVFMSPVKEPDFFAEPVLDLVATSGSDRQASLLDDARMNPEFAAHVENYLALFDAAGSHARRGEASAVYLGHPTAAEHISHYVPDARLIAILRDPAERAYSHLVHGRRIYAEHGRTSAIGAEGRTVDDEFLRAVEAALQHGMPSPATSDPEVWVRSGFYFAHLTRWLSLFPRDQLLVRRFEDLEGDVDEFMRSIFTFLDVDSAFTLPTTEAFNASVVPRSRRLFALFTTKNRVMRFARRVAPAQLRALAMRTRNRYLGSAKPALEPELRAKLVEIYRSDVTSLQDLVGWDLSAWLQR